MEALTPVTIVDMVSTVVIPAVQGEGETDSVTQSFHDGIINACPLKTQSINLVSQSWCEPLHASCGHTPKGSHWIFSFHHCFPQSPFLSLKHTKPNMFGACPSVSNFRSKGVHFFSVDLKYY